MKNVVILHLNMRLSQDLEHLLKIFITKIEKLKSFESELLTCSILIWALLRLQQLQIL